MTPRALETLLNICVNGRGIIDPPSKGVCIVLVPDRMQAPMLNYRHSEMEEFVKRYVDLLCKEIKVPAGMELKVSRGTKRLSEFKKESHYIDRPYIQISIVPPVALDSEQEIYLEGEFSRAHNEVAAKIGEVEIHGPEGTLEPGQYRPSARRKASLRRR